MNGKSTYIINDILGFYVVGADSATKAWAKHMTSTTSIDGVIAFDKEQLYKWLNSRGYQTISKTNNSSVYAIN